MLFTSCKQQSVNAWESSIIDLDSLDQDVLERKTALATYLDSTRSQEFLKANICIFPIVDTSTEYFQELLLLPLKVQNDFGELLNRNNIRAVDLRRLYPARNNWCQDSKHIQSAGIIRFYNASRVDNHAMVTVLLDILPKAGNMYVLLFHKDQFGSWNIQNRIELSTF